MNIESMKKIANNLVALEFDTQQALNKYKREHNVRKDTKLKVKEKEEKPIDNKNSIKMTKLQKHLDDLLNEIQGVDLVNVKKDVASSLNAHPSTLDKLSDEENVDIRINVAKNIRTSEKTLDKLSQDKKKAVRFAVADNVNTSPKTLDKMSEDKDVLVRDLVAQNSNTSGMTLKKLSKDKDYLYTRLHVLKNPNTDLVTIKKGMEELRQLINNISQQKGDNDETVKSLTQFFGNCAKQVDEKVASIGDTTLIFRLSNEGYEKTKISHAMKSDNEQILKMMAVHDNPIIRAAVANNKNLNKFPRIQRDLSIDGDEEVRANLAVNPKISAQTMNVLKNDESERVRNFANSGVNKVFDLTKLSPELRQKVKSWSIEDIKKFIGWLKKDKTLKTNELQ